MLNFWYIYVRGSYDAAIPVKFETTLFIKANQEESGGSFVYADELKTRTSNLAHETWSVPTNNLMFLRVVDIIKKRKFSATGFIFLLILLRLLEGRKSRHVITYPDVLCWDAVSHSILNLLTL